MPELWNLPIAYDVLQAAVVECLARRVVGLYETPTVRETQGSVTYDIVMAFVGTPASITVRKLGKRLSELYIQGPLEVEPFIEISSTEREMWQRMGWKGAIEEWRQHWGRQDYYQHNEMICDYYEGLVSDIVACLNQQPIEWGQKDSAKNERFRGPNEDTREKLRVLAENRERDIEDRNEITKWSMACEIAGVSRKTAKYYLPELRKRWDDNTYRLPSIEENIRNL